MISKFFNGGKVLHAVALTALLSTQLFAGFGSVSSNADRYPGLGTLFPAFGGSADFKSARLYTDKASYLASDTVRINGEGFDGYERVRFAVGSENKDGTSALVIAQWDVYADGKGRVETTWDVPSSDTFTVTASGDVSGLTGKIEITPEAGESIGKLEQCANGPGLPQGQSCPSTGSSGWVTGNVGPSKSQYVEGDSIAYRVELKNLDIGDQYEYKIGYDVTKGGINAIDYLTTYNRTISNANPCLDLACSGAPTSTFAIPIDPKVTAGRDQVPATSDDITQIPGVITMWGGTITALNPSPSGYSYTGGTFPTAGDTSASITIRFTATATTGVIAWGGHISTRADWGATFGSVNISGSPYHMFNLSGGNISEGTTGIFNGNREVQLSVTAVIAPAKIVIYKHASPPSSFVFGFTTTNLPIASFNMTDTTSDPAHVFDGVGAHQPANSTDDARQEIIVNDFTGTKVITESSPAPYTLQGINCAVTEDFLNNGGSSFTILVPSANITLAEGDTVTCTFFNNFTTATEATITGRVLSPNGSPLKDAWVSATDSNGSTVTARTNQFGRYTMTVEGGLSLFMDVAHKNYTFGSQLINVNEENVTVDFTGVAR